MNILGLGLFVKIRGHLEMGSNNQFIEKIIFRAIDIESNGLFAASMVNTYVYY